MIMKINTDINDKKINIDIVEYFYKIVIVYIQANFITWLILISGGVVICHSGYQANFRK